MLKGCGQNPAIILGLKQNWAKLFQENERLLLLCSKGQAGMPIQENLGNRLFPYFKTNIPKKGVFQNVFPVVAPIQVLPVEYVVVLSNVLGNNFKIYLITNTDYSYHREIIW